MSTRRVVLFALATLLAVTGAGLLSPAQAGSLTYEIVADTTLADSGLNPGSGAAIQVTLSAATPPSPASLSVDVFNVSTDGTLGSVFYSTGTAAGDLTTSVTADNTVYSELDQNFTIALGTFPAHSYFDVFVTLSGSEIGSGFSTFTGTAFSLNIYDNSVTEIGVTGLVSDGTVAWSTSTTTPSGTVPSAPIYVYPQTATVPEPSALILAQQPR